MSFDLNVCETCEGHGHVTDDGAPDPTMTGDGCDDCGQTGRLDCAGCGEYLDRCTCEAVPCPDCGADTEDECTC